jgi:purine-nucleoside phosphorylase
MGSWTGLALDCAQAARAALGLPAAESPLAVILGSGLGAFAQALEDAEGVPFTRLPGFPPPTVEGHAGRLVYGKLAHTPVLALQGRIHGYEGHDAATVAFPARVLAALGARALVVTNAAGGCNPSFVPGDLMRITDHINFTGRNPLGGPNEDRLGPRFPDLTHVWDARLATALEEAARGVGQTLRAGVYMQMNGPSYETPAEIRYLRAIGADLVGMSTVPEVIAANHMGLRVLALSCVTNMAAGILPHKITHAEVLETGAQVRGTLVKFLKALLPRLA